MPALAASTSAAGAASADPESLEHKQSPSPAPPPARKKHAKVPVHLLEDAVDKYSQSGTLRETAKVFGIAVNTLRVAIRNKRTYGAVIKPGPGARRGPKHALNQEASDFIVELLAQSPDMYLGEVCAQLDQAMDIKVSQATVCRELQRLQVKRTRVSRRRVGPSIAKNAQNIDFGPPESNG